MMGNLYGNGSYPILTGLYHLLTEFAKKTDNLKRQEKTSRNDEWKICIFSGKIWVSWSRITAFGVPGLCRRDDVWARKVDICTIVSIVCFAHHTAGRVWHHQSMSVKIFMHFTLIHCPLITELTALRPWGIPYIPNKNAFSNQTLLIQLNFNEFVRGSVHYTEIATKLKVTVQLTSWWQVWIY